MSTHFRYLVFWGIFSLVFYVTSIVTSNEVVIGNSRFFGVEASIYAGFWSMFISFTVLDFLAARGVDYKKGIIFMGLLFGSNSAAVWMVARLAHIIGLGIGSFHWAFVLGGIAAGLQTLAVNLTSRQYSPKKKRKK